jgi:hypothetical protein
MIADYYIDRNIMCPSSETPMCEECGAVFVTVEELSEHQEAEKEYKRLRHSGLDDG